MEKPLQIERQEKPHVETASIENRAAFNFQLYSREYLAFSIKRIGLLYGHMDEKEPNVAVIEVIYEPPQNNTADTINIQENRDEQTRVDLMANIFNYQLIGIAIARQTEEVQLTAQEIKFIAELQNKVPDPNHFVILTVILNDKNETVLEAFQLTDTILQLSKEHKLVDSDDKKNIKVEKPVLVLLKETSLIDISICILPIAVRGHTGPLDTKFPIENRSIQPTTESIKKALMGKANHADRLSDFHFLLFLSQEHLLGNEIISVCETIKNKGALTEGYKVLIDSLAGM